MKLTINKPTEVEVTAVRIVVAVRYGEDDIPNDFPLRRGDIWEAVVDIATGKIRDWPVGQEGNLRMKVCDEGSYYLIDPVGATVASIKDDYVPHELIPGEFGDYIDLEINEDGIITNWPKNPELSTFFNN